MERKKWGGWIASYERGLTEGVRLLVPDHLRGKGWKEEQWGVSLKDWEPDPEGKVRATDPSTSRVAAFSNFPLKGTQRWLIAHAHFLHPWGLTNHELLRVLIDRGTPIINDSLTTRVSELHPPLGDWLEDSGLKRMGENGTPQVVWRITPKGLHEFTGPLEIETE